MTKKKRQRERCKKNLEPEALLSLTDRKNIVNSTRKKVNRRFWAEKCPHQAEENNIPWEARKTRYFNGRKTMPLESTVTDDPAVTKHTQIKSVVAGNLEEAEERARLCRLSVWCRRAMYRLSILGARPLYFLGLALLFCCCSVTTGC